MTAKEQPWVCVKMKIMFGYEDGHRLHYAIVPKSEWAKDKKMFFDYLKKNNKESVTRKDRTFGEYRIRPETWTATLCTAQEARVLKKFLGEAEFYFAWPSHFVQDDWKHTDEEE